MKRPIRINNRFLCADHISAIWSEEIQSRFYIFALLTGGEKVTLWEQQAPGAYGPDGAQELRAWREDNDVRLRDWVKHLSTLPEDFYWSDGGA